MSGVASISHRKHIWCWVWGACHAFVATVALLDLLGWDFSALSSANESIISAVVVLWAGLAQRSWLSMVEPLTVLAHSRVDDPSGATVVAFEAGVYSVHAWHIAVGSNIAVVTVALAWVCLVGSWFASHLFWES